MSDDDALDLITGALRPLGAEPDVGEEFRAPPLDVLRYYRRRVRLNRIPVVGRALSVVGVVRQPADLHGDRAGYGELLERLAKAINGRYPPIRRGHGLSVGLTALVLTADPIRPEDEALLEEACHLPPRYRSVLLGLFRLNPDQQVMTFARPGGSDPLFPEPRALADALLPRFRRFVPLVEM